LRPSQIELVQRATPASAAALLLDAVPVFIDPVASLGELLVPAIADRPKQDAGEEAGGLFPVAHIVLGLADGLRKVAVRGEPLALVLIADVFAISLLHGIYLTFILS